MAVKKTIAIVGATGKDGRKIVNQFACMPYRLLLVSNKINELEELTNDISEKHPEAEVESLNCVKDGCWEADIIILAVASEEEKQVAEAIKEVATQKIVVAISNKENSTGLEKILPYSRLVKVFENAETNEVLINGADAAANEPAWAADREIIRIFNFDGLHTIIKN